MSCPLGSSVALGPVRNADGNQGCQQAGFRAVLSFMVEKHRTYHGHGNRNLEFSGGQGECGRLGELERTSPDVQI